MLNSLNDADLEVEPLLEVDDVMSILKCSRAAVWRYMHKNGLPYLKMGGKQSRVRVRPEALRDWLKAQEIVEVR